MINITNKEWGQNILIFKNDSTEIHQIFINCGGRSSKHYHKYKNNIFFIQRGKLLVERWGLDNTIESFVLNEKDTIDIQNGIYHRFTAIEDTSAIEIYYISINTNDIYRDISS